jgi:pimeloyl-[acyl-carrier protein] methyl ester esterase
MRDNSQPMSLHVRVSGHGPDIVLLHGWGLHSGVWADVLPQLETGFRITCIDLPGHGMSPAVISLRDLDALCAGLHEVMPVSAACVGWSLGVLIALAYATRFSRSCQRLILVASQPCFTRAPDWPNAISVETLDAFAVSLAQDCRATLERFLALQVQGSGNRQHTLRRLLAVLNARRPVSAALQAGLVLLRETDLRSHLSSVACPVRLILGERDTLVPASSGRAVVGHLKDGRYEILSQAGHAPFISHAEDFIRVLQTFLDD